MLRIPKARKEAILNKMMSPYPPTIVSLSKQEGISEATLYNWRKQLRQEGRPVPEYNRTSESWSAQTKFAIVVETAPMTESELAEYWQTDQTRGEGSSPQRESVSGGGSIADPTKKDARPLGGGEDE